MNEGVVTRERLVDAIRTRLLRDTFPRLTIALAIALAGGCAFLASVTALDAGVTSMAVRYPLSVLIGYLAFLVFIRVWIAIKRGRLDPGETVRNSDWIAESPLAPGRGPGTGLVEALDLDELGWVLAGAVVLCGGLAAVAYVIYVAPLLLAEVALDAALVSSLYRRLRKQDLRHWSISVIAHTWKPAALLVAILAVAGFLMQLAAPDAVSIGGVFPSLRRW